MHWNCDLSQGDRWVSLANIIWLESPAGVGFSVASGRLPAYNDTGVAADNLMFLKKWFEKYPEFAKNEFWIAGEYVLRA